MPAVARFRRLAGIFRLPARFLAETLAWFFLPPFFGPVLSGERCFRQMAMPRLIRLLLSGPRSTTKHSKMNQVITPKTASLHRTYMSENSAVKSQVTAGQTMKWPRVNAKRSETIFLTKTPPFLLFAVIELSKYTPNQLVSPMEAN